MDQGYCPGDDVLVEERWVKVKRMSIIWIKVGECSAGSMLKMIDGMRLSEVKKHNITERREQRDN
jgi:hypothetical protein